MAEPCISTAMVDAQFCSPQRTVFTLTKRHTREGSQFDVTSFDDGAAVMQVETDHIGYRNLRSLRFHDRVQRQVMAVEEVGIGHLRRWEAFKGYGTSGSDRLFVAVNATRAFRGERTVHVFLGSNSSVDDRAPDFLVHGSHFGGAMTVTRGGDQGHDKDIAVIDRKKMCTVWIKPGVDQALIFALTVIVDQIFGYRYCACFRH